MPFGSGGGGGFTGGTVHGATTFAPTALGAEAILITPPVGATAAQDNEFTLTNDVGTELVNFDAGGNIDFNLRGTVVGTDSGEFSIDGGGATLFVIGSNATFPIAIQPPAGKSLKINSPLYTAPPAPGTQVFVSGAAAQISTSRDVHSFTPVTFNPGAATTATCLVEVSPDNVTFTTLWTETVPAGVALDGTIHGLYVYLPAIWRLRFTVNAQAVLGTTAYF